MLMVARRSARVAASEATTAKPRPARNARISMTLNVPARTRTETASAQNDINAPVIQRTTATRFLAGTLVVLPSCGAQHPRGGGWTTSNRSLRVELVLGPRLLEGR